MSSPASIAVPHCVPVPGLSACPGVILFDASKTLHPTHGEVSENKVEPIPQGSRAL